MRVVVALSAFVIACEAAPPAPVTFTAMTFNTGTSEGMGHDSGPDDGYGSAQAALSDLHYGDGLAWQAVVDDVRDYLRDVAPDVVGFQEIFHSADCATIPAEARDGFVCATWRDGDPTVANVILGDDYRVACHVGHADKCLGVKRSFASIEGCDDDLCLDGLDGAAVEGCGHGARVGRAHLTLAGGDALTVVNVHGSSGMSDEDMECRRQQFAQVFDDLVDGAQNVVLGDFNTDPGRLYGADPSADEILKHVGKDRPFDFVSDVGESAEPTYAGLFNIDHVVADGATGTCAPRAGVSDVKYLDHEPLACALTLP